MAVKMEHRKLRIQYFSRDDLAFNYMANKSVELFNRKKKGEGEPEVNDLIECMHAARYLDDILRESGDVDISTADVNRFKQETGASLGKLLGGKTMRQLGELSKSLAIEYRQDFIDWLFKCRKKLFEEEDVAKILYEAGFPLFELVDAKCMRTHQEEELAELYRQNPYPAAELIIGAIFNVAEHCSFIPKQLTDSDIEKILEAYLASGQENLNFVKVVAEARKSGFTRTSGVRAVSPRTMREYRRFYQDSLSDLKEGDRIKLGVKVLLVDDLDDLISLQFKEETCEEVIRIDRAYLLSSMSNEEILDNFIYLFGLTSVDGILTAPSYASEASVFERVAGVRAADFYPENVVFNFKEIRLNALVSFYHSFLLHNGVYLEEVVKWFFEIYLKEEFGVRDFLFSIPSEDTSMLERCKSLLPGIESVVQQYAYWIEEGAVDHELIELSGRDVDYGNLPSRAKCKYLVPSSCDEKIRAVLHLLFSDQSVLLLQEECRVATDFPSAVLSAELSIEDFGLHSQQHALKLLEEVNLISIDTGAVQIVDWVEVEILRRVHQHGATMVTGHLLGERAASDRLVASGLLNWEGKLLTKEESEYFNYCLNNKFRNGLALRNIILHGGMRIAQSEREQFLSYFLVLKLLICLVIKINDDLCFYRDCSQKKRNSGASTVENL